MLKLQKPPLVRETSINSTFWSKLKSFTIRKKDPFDIYSNVILKKELKSKMEVISNAIVNRKNNNSF